MTLTLEQLGEAIASRYGLKIKPPTVERWLLKGAPNDPDGFVAFYRNRRRPGGYQISSQVKVRALGQKLGHEDANGDNESVEAWHRRDKRAGALRKELDLEKARGKAIEFALVEEFMAHLVGVIFWGEMDRMTEEFPAVLKGKTEVEISVEVKKQIEAMKVRLNAALDAWVKSKGEKE